MKKIKKNRLSGFFASASRTTGSIIGEYQQGKRSAQIKQIDLGRRQEAAELSELKALRAQKKRINRQNELERLRAELKPKEKKENNLLFGGPGSFF